MIGESFKMEKNKLCIKRKKNTIKFFNVSPKHVNDVQEEVNDFRYTLCMHMWLATAGATRGRMTDGRGTVEDRGGEERV